MAKRMLIDATHPEETRVVVLNGHRLEEFDFETSTKKQVKGNIYLAKVTRVEPSLQAAFVDYGGNRHGFLAFSEIHPDYYRIPVGDRGDALDERTGQETEFSNIAGETGGEEAGVAIAIALPEQVPVPDLPEVSEDEPELEPAAPSADGATDTETPISAEPAPEPVMFAAPAGEPPPVTETLPASEPLPWEDVVVLPQGGDERAMDDAVAGSPGATAAYRAEPAAEDAIEAPAESALDLDSDDGEADTVETIGGDEFEEVESQRSRSFRHYKIQEVIKRRQIMLVQVTKEERGNKGAALTTYLSLAGRYCVLMPNTARGGGVSRKITSLSDRRRLKDILEELDIPEGMGVIVRTAGGERSKAEIRRDYEYLLRLWNEIRELTLRSTAPALIYEEGNLIKRSIRDLYTRDIDEVLVEGDEGYRTAKAFMKMLMPSHAKRVQPYRDAQIGLLHRFQVESQIDAIHSPIVQLRSGGYVVINQTEALVAIDVNSGRSTRERNIEETALRTNLEAAEEIARQLRLRDLAGLIVIDFIDMEEHRNQGAVERRLKEALKNDRARIQVGRISPFGLLEMSRQRLRPSLVEASTQPCPHCGGTGFIRSTESTALYVLRSIEEEGMRRRSAEICIYVPTAVALYILNQKRDSLTQIESRYGIHVLVARDDALIPPAFRLERLRAYEAAETGAALPTPLTQTPVAVEADDEEEEEAEQSAAERPEAEAESEEEPGRGRRRRRRRRRHGGESDLSEAAEPVVAAAAGEDDGRAAEDAEGQEETEAERQRRRRGRRGGRRRPRREPGAEVEQVAALAGPAAEAIEVLPVGGFGEAPEADETESEWPSEIGVEIAAAAAEVASLPALAGDMPHSTAAQIEEIATSAEREPAPTFASPVEPASEELAARPFWSPPSEPAPPPLTAPETVASETAGPAPVAAAMATEIVAAEPPAAEPPAAEPPAAEPPAAGPPAAEPPADGEPSTAAEPPVATELAAATTAAQPAIPVQTVTDRPVNPRRGWWQRLVQS
jgi:ribonuclease E